MQDQVAVELVPAGDGWVARVNGHEFPVVTYGVEAPEVGKRPLVSLMFAADSVTMRNSSAPAAEGRTAVQDVADRPFWGSSATDPRENISGWRPENLGEQVARNAEATA